MNDTPKTLDEIIHSFLTWSPTQGQMTGEQVRLRAKDEIVNLIDLIVGDYRKPRGGLPGVGDAVRNELRIEQHKRKRELLGIREEAP